MSQKKFNLCFNMNNPKAREAYNLIMQKGVKAEFIIDAIIEKEHRSGIDIENVVLKAIAKAFGENGNKFECNDVKEDEISDDVLNMFIV